MRTPLAKLICDFNVGKCALIMPFQAEFADMALRDRLTLRE